MNVHCTCLILTHSSHPTLHQLAIAEKIDTRAIPRQEFDGCIDAWLRFTIPIDQQARVAKTYHFLGRHLKLQRTNLSRTVEGHHRCFPISCKSKIALLLRDRWGCNIASGAAQKANNIIHRLMPVPRGKRATIGQFPIERVEVAVGMLRCPLHALLKRNGCCHDTAALVLLLIQGKRVGEAAGRSTDRICLSKITRVYSSSEMSIQREIPGATIVLLHAHKRHHTWSQLIKENTLTIWQYTHHVRIIGVAATSIGRRCALNPVSHFQVGKFIQVTIGVKSEIERRGGAPPRGGASSGPRLPPANTSFYTPTLLSAPPEQYR